MNTNNAINKNKKIQKKPHIRLAKIYSQDLQFRKTIYISMISFITLIPAYI